MKKKYIWFIGGGVAAVLIAVVILLTLPTIQNTRPDEADMTLLESSWESTAKGYSEFVTGEKPVFYHRSPGKDAIRYYGKFNTQGGDGPVTHHILFIPCTGAAVPAQVTVGRHTFRSRTPFLLLTATVTEIGGKEQVSFSALGKFFLGGESKVSGSVLNKALQLHEQYEKEIYGSVLKELPAFSPATGEERLLRLRVAYMTETGILADMATGLRDYGTYDGWDVIRSSGDVLGAAGMGMHTVKIDGIQFANAGSLYAYRDGKLIPLEEAYEQGLVTRASIEALAEVHKNWG